jgi:superkiller protein 3
VKKVALIALTLCALLPGAARGQNKAADAAAQQNARGAALLKDGKFEEAVAELQKAADAAPTSAVVQSNLAYAYDRQGRTEEAVAAYRKALELDPKNTIVRNNLANLYSKQGQVSSALQGADSKPKDPQAAYNAARVYARLGDADQALTWLNKALDLGYDQFDYLSLDPSLVNLKKDPRFLKLLEERRPAR